MEIKKDDKLFFKGKYGMFYEVTVISVEGDYASVKGSDVFGNKKVRIENLRKKPSKEFQEMSHKVRKETDKMQEELWRIKDNL